MATLVSHGLQLQRQIAALRSKYAEARRARAVSANLAWWASMSATSESGAV